MVLYATRHNHTCKVSWQVYRISAGGRPNDIFSEYPEVRPALVTDRGITEAIVARFEELTLYNDRISRDANNLIGALKG